MALLCARHAGGFVVRSGTGSDHHDLSPPAAITLARSLAGWLADRRPPASAGVEVPTRQVTVVKHADTSVRVHRVEMALVVRTPEWPADDEQPAGSKGQQR
jgi:hypothetical protein